ncbi:MULTISPECIES: hybrid sensor histidine kinase/response regulator [Methylobacterium]|mgnify:CR=1 FL=1|jgi:two-component system chemotaxis sensor kinase CheA|uniref:hybrid sensor histidine kinase/response regulator n=2 Tax=Methylobacteriaceae TaxID=119045 RepID=UPI00190DCA47|nr:MULTISPECIES: hybrid sensor histidine kinase/response regulator [Methylobacterium]MBK3398674.1 hybrid sensor histidine kinase/response regulator [Methylobacterium ajmalii]MBZ6413979.1 hybrid sensor histidine kinase/response regulator [Methylobacterium sp.]
MDDLLREFLTESGEHLDTVDLELVRFEQDPNNQTILRNIFRLVHTIKGTCGFLGLPRLEALAHAAETLMGKFRDGMPVTSPAVSLILQTLDRIKVILAELERTGGEPAGVDEDLIGALERMSEEPVPAPEPVPVAAPAASGTLVPQVLERALKPGEVSLDDLERAFRDTAVEIEAPAPEALAPMPAPEPVRPAARPEPVRQEAAAAAPAEARRAEPARSEPQPAAESESGPVSKVQTIRVNVDTLEHLMTMVSELVLTRNQLLEIARRHEDGNYKVPLQRLSHVTAELQEGVMKTRMQPIGSAWQKLPRVVRDLSSELGKKIDLVMQGAETELDRQVLEVIKDPLTHMVRNSADHGIESGAERKSAGKPEKGTIRLNAFHEGGTITIEIADDGKGLDLSAIRRKAVERGVATEAEVERMTDAQVAKFIFHAGFSTAKAVTSVSGRGVGMDVVKTNIELIGGTIDIQTQLGAGTTFTIKIPLTLAIVAALIVSAREHRFAIPQVSVLELVRVQPGTDHAVERINGSPVLRLRDRLLPIVPVAAMLGLDAPDAPASTDEGFVVVSQVGRQRFGILVDGVFHTEEIVVKPMSSKLRHIPLFSGNTILGDGAVVLIIDPNGVARMVGSGTASGQPGEIEAEAEGDENAGDQAVTLLVFKGGGDALKAVPLSLVTRLEEIDASKIEWVGGRPLIQYRGRLMPLVPADPAQAMKRDGAQALVVFSDGERSMGLVVDEIVDIVDEVLDVELVTERSDLIGSAVVRNRATEIVNIAHYLPLAHDDWGQPTHRAVPKAPSLLLVDDSAFFREMLTPVLKAAGFRVAQAADAEEAMRHLLGEARTDLVVCDLEMPGRSGFDLIEAMRKAGGRLAEMPVVALAGTMAPDSIARARALGVADCVAKFDRSGLVAAVNEIASAPLDAAA